MAYIIHWKFNSTGVTGHGEKSMELNLAESWIAHLNEKYPDMHHWYEQTIQ
jgi:hypothetical protein